jgi:tripartite-type tricarboxylate transporter receptor subunit TctC
MRIVRTLAVAAGLLAGCLAAHADAYPSRPVRLIVPFPAGSAIDTIARAVADKMAPALGQPIVIEPMPGGGTVRATQYAIRQPADGYTMLVVTTSAAIKSAVRNPPFDIRKELSFVGQFSGSPLFLAVATGLPVKTPQELIAYAKANPGKLNVSSYGTGTLSHLTAELFMHATGASMVHVPYAGSTANAMAVAQGATQVTFDVSNTLRPYQEKGSLRYIAVTSAKRTPEAPELPSLSESGVPQVDVQTWGGIAVPAGTPPEVVARLSAALAVSMKDPAVVDFFRRTGFGLLQETPTPAQFAALAGKTVESFGKLIRDANLDVE